ncbi:hypothetical protein G9A89_017289 [Geosiphon pyriformis]|nr:hypothetical protein G9A89_017289 [Geosiphon pyriformis]
MNRSPLEIKKTSYDSFFESFQRLLISQDQAKEKSTNDEDITDEEQDVFSQIPGFKWCPNLACKSGQIHEDGEASPLMTCVSCGQKSCIIHDQKIESGYPCDKCFSNSTKSMEENQMPNQITMFPIKIPHFNVMPMASSSFQERLSGSSSKRISYLYEDDETSENDEEDDYHFRKLFGNSELLLLMCPNVNCHTEQFYDPSIDLESPFLTCEKCGQISCILHNQIIESSLPCLGCDKDLVERLREEEESQYESTSDDDSKIPKSNKGKGQEIPIEIQFQQSNEPIVKVQPIKANPVVKPANYESIVLSKLHECIICTDEFPTNQFLPVTIECTHEDNVCRECVRTHIQHELSDKGNFRIVCPGENCKIIMQDFDVRRFVDSGTLDRFHQLSVNSVLSQMEDFRWCKNPNCKAGQIHFEGDDAPIMVCKACGQKSCAQHDLPISQNLGCTECKKIREAYLAEQEANELANQRFLQREEAEEKERQATEAREREAARQEILRHEKEEAEAQERARQERERAEEERRGEQASNELIQLNTKTCPKCKSKIEKDGGCEHMTCRAPGCGYEFCWQCLADYNTIRRLGNDQHTVDCKFHSNNLN